MSEAPPLNAAESKQILDKIVSTAYSNPAFMKFLQITVDTFARKATMQLTLHVKAGEAKGGDGRFSF